MKNDEFAAKLGNKNCMARGQLFPRQSTKMSRFGDK
jgi:hypothetical protein